MLDERLEAIRARRVVIRGPWRTLEEQGTPWTIEDADGRVVAAAQQIENSALTKGPDRRRTANAQFISHAPADIDLLLERVERFRNGIEYRPGLPSLEQVQQHEEKRGGWWQHRFRHPVAGDSPMPVWRHLSVGVHGMIKISKWHDGKLRMLELARSLPNVVELRPVDSHGTPCSWLDKEEAQS